MKLCSMHHESCIKFDRVALLKRCSKERFGASSNTVLDRIGPIPYILFYETFPNISLTH